MGSKLGTLRGGYLETARRIARMWSGVVPQQPPTMLTQPVARPFLRAAPAICSGRLVVLAHVVGQAGVRIDADQRVGDMGDLVDGGPQLLGAEGAVEARRRTACRCLSEYQKASGVWPDRVRPGEIGDGAGEHDRQLDAHLVEDLLNGEARRLGVQRVEDGLDQDRVDAALDQRRGPASR